MNDLLSDALSAVALQQENQHTTMTVEEIVRTALSVVYDGVDWDSTADGDKPHD